MNYTTFARSAIGATHRISNLPNQDSYKVSRLDKLAIIAIADGHGSAKCKWSQIGAKLAVEVFCDMIKELFDYSTEKNTFFDNLCAARHEMLPKRLVKCWQEKVIQDSKRRQSNLMHGLLVDEAKLFDEPDKIFELYGTTLLGLILTDDFYLAVQLGDGDIVSVSIDGSVERVLDPVKILGVETHSLSQKDAWSNINIQPIKPSRMEDMPVLFLLSTDGLANSYINDQAFLKVGYDYLEWLREGNIDNFQEKMYYILRQTSKVGSGDDITLAIAANLYRIKGEGGYA